MIKFRIVRLGGDPGSSSEHEMQFQVFLQEGGRETSDTERPKAM